MPSRLSGGLMADPFPPADPPARRGGDPVLWAASPFDAVSPRAVAGLAETSGVRKARLGLLPLSVLAVLAGAFIAFGAMFSTLILTEPGLGFGPSRALAGVGFSLGLILVIVGGAELFTGNALIVMAWAQRRVSAAALLRNWGVVYLGNLVGALATAAVVAASGALDLHGGGVADTARRIALAKVGLGPVEAFLLGVLCNALVCLAVWMCFAARDVAGKILCIVFPISAFVALGFEHSVANMYLIPVAMMATDAAIPVSAFVANLVPVTLGNIVGGGVLVALVYWVVWLRGESGAEGAARGP